MAISYAQSGQIESANAQALNQPKELGALQRIDGLRSGLQAMRSRLESFMDRLDGNAGEKANGLSPVSATLSGTIGDAEGELRICLSMIDTINDRF